MSSQNSGQLTVATITGYMFRGSELNEVQQQETERTLRTRIRELYCVHKVGYIYGGLACGSDIIMAETALEHGVEFSAILPFNMDKFVETSIRIGDPTGESGKWESRFYSVLSHTGTPTIMQPGKILDCNLDGYFFYAFRYAAGMALQQAALLNTQCRLIAVADQQPPTNIAGPNQALRDWQAHRRPADVISYPDFRPTRAGPKSAAINFRPIIFIVGSALLSREVRKILDQLLADVTFKLERVNGIAPDGREGIGLIAVSSEQALKVALSVIKHASKGGIALRVICDFRCMFGEARFPGEELLALIDARKAGLVDSLVATQAFAMQAKYDMGDAVRLVLAEPIEMLASGACLQEKSGSLGSFPFYTMQEQRSAD